MLIFDGNVLCERAWHTTGQLRNGVIFGFLKQFVTTSKNFPCEQCVCVFDSKVNYRRDLTKSYKTNRGMNAQKKAWQDDDDERKRIRAELDDKYRQIDLIVEVLQRLGICTFRVAGYEGDDLIAAVVELQRMRKMHEHGVHTRVVSTDEDLYQLLSSKYKVSMTKGNNMGSEYTENDLLLEHDELVNAAQWAEVKTLMGCKGDTIAGIPGIGLRTALKWLETSPEEPGALCTPRIQKLVAAHSELIKLNRQLVELPFRHEQEERSSVFDYVDEDTVYGGTFFGSDMGAYQRLKEEKAMWNKVCMDLQMPSLKAK